MASGRARDRRDHVSGCTSRRGPEQPGPSIHRRRLRESGTVSGAGDHDAGRRPEHPGELAGRRAILVSPDRQRDQRVRAGRSGEEVPPACVRSRQSLGRAAVCRGPERRSSESPVHGPRVHRRRSGVSTDRWRHSGDMPRRFQQLPPLIRRASCRHVRRRTGARRRRRPGRSRGGPFARRTPTGVHSRSQPVGSRRHDGPGNRAHDGRRQGLRVRDEQRRLDEERRAGCRLVARFEEDRDVPARWPQRRRDVSRQHDGRTSHAAGLEIPAAG